MKCRYLDEKTGRIKQFSASRKLIIDRDKIDSVGFQRWADIQNMKNVSNMINMLESYDIHSTAELKPTAGKVFARRAMLSQSIEHVDEKIKELSDRIELARQFQRTRPFHDEYKSLSGRKRKAYAKDNAPVLDEYKSVGSKLKSLYPDGKFPSVSSLDKQRQDLHTEREKLYGEYYQLKKEYADLDKARQTIEQYLKSQRDELTHSRRRNQLE